MGQKSDYEGLTTIVRALSGTVKLFADKGARGNLGSGGVAVALWSGDCRAQSGELVPGGEAGGHLLAVLLGAEPVATGLEVW